MANITASTSEKIFQIKAWAGLHENPDGDTKLKMGEAAAMRNFAITRDGNLRRRAGSKTIWQLSGNAPVNGMWNGFVKGEEQFLAACDNKIWKLYDDGKGENTKEAIGDMDTSQEVFFFGFSDILYIINGKEYNQWDGVTFKKVDGYVPIVATTVPPMGGGETLEQVNKLSGSRRIWLSPDGKGDTFNFPK